MKTETREWIAKAEGDFSDAARGIRARKNPNYDGVCFHVQQCIEKYLKGRMVEAGIRFGKTHDLAKLLDLLLSLEPTWESWRHHLNLLTSFAVEFRYPGEAATQDDAKEAFNLCRVFRGSIRASLGLREEGSQPPATKRKSRKE